MIPRTECAALVNQASNHAISVLIGSRQVGKSTLMRMIEQSLGKPCSWYNLENPQHLALFNEGYTSFIRDVREKLVFIDEFQYCPSVSSLFKAVYDLNPDVKIYASGSSSLEIQAHLKESLAGRKLERVIFPLSFSEWMQARDERLAALPAPGETVRVDDGDAYRAGLEEYLRFGGMPGLVALSDEVERREYLQGIYQTYIAKDIKSFLRDESVLSFNKMISYLALNNGGQLNKQRLQAIAGVSSRQIERYVDVLQGTFTLALVPPLFSNRGKELVKTPRFYFYDQGVANAICQDFRPPSLRNDRGQLHEQFVFWELRKSMDARYSIKYWRTQDGKEVDFVLEKDRSFLPIEVKSLWKAGKVPPGILSFFSLYPETRTALVLYDGPATTQAVDGRTVLFAPLYAASGAYGLLP